MRHFKHIKNLISKISRFGFLIPLGNLFIVYVGKLLSPALLTAFARKRHEIIEDKILKIVGYEVFNISNLNTSNVQDSANIWVLWLQGENNMPELVKVCLESIKKNAGHHKVVVLSNSNIHEYITLSERIKALYSKGKISNAHYSDIIRMALLGRYGGVWIDATIFLTSNLDDKIFNVDLFTIKNAPKGNNVSERRWAGFFIAAKPKGYLPVIVDRIFTSYWEKEDVLIDYFFIDYAIDLAYKYNTTVKQQIDSLEENNPNIYDLLPFLPRRFDKQEFSLLTNNTSIFKLSWKKYNLLDLIEQDSFYSHIKGLYIS